MPHDPRLSLTIKSVSVYMRFPKCSVTLYGVHPPKLWEIPYSGVVECVDDVWFIISDLPTLEKTDTL